MSLYYEDDCVRLYHGDCRAMLPMTADVILTDPPYAVRWSADACSNCGNDDPCADFDLCSDCLALGYDSGWRRPEMLGWISPNWHEKATHSRGYADHDPEAFADLLHVVWEQSRHSLPPGGLAVAFCGNRTMHEMCTAAARAGWEVLDLLTFVSTGGVAKSPTTLKPGHELAAVLRTDGPRRQINPDWTRTNVYMIPKGRAEADHLTPKPVAWMQALVRDFTERTDVILDPFAGSGTTLRAAKDEGRKAIGIELDERACEVAATRLTQEVFDFGGAA